MLDRLTGKVLLAEPFVKKLTWASGIGADGRPKLLPGNEPTVGRPAGLSGGRGRGELAVDARSIPRPACSTCSPRSRATSTRKNDQWWEAGKSFYGGGTRRAPGDSAAASF